MAEFKPDDQSTMDYTANAEQVAELRRQAELTGRHLIGRDTDVLNGVYGGAYGGEAIVVDYNSEPGLFDGLVEEVKRRASEPRPDGTSGIAKDLILHAVFDVTRQTMKYSMADVDEILRLVGGRDHRKIGLSAYIDRGVGVCRHQALLAASMLEILRNQGFVGGRASVERSMQWPEQGDSGGHSWVRYTSSTGEVYILDPAQDFIGTLRESRSRDKGWNYLRPEDKAEEAKPEPKLITEADIPKGAETDNPAADLKAFLSKFTPDERHVVELEGQNGESFADILAKLHITEEPLSPEKLLANARWIEDEDSRGDISYRLRRQTFIDDKKFQSVVSGKTAVHIQLDKAAHISPEQIAGANGFKSWTGRGEDGQAIMQDRQSAEIQTSMRTIIDYATKPSPLPPVDISIAIWPDGRTLTLSENAHRAAAAKLRNEPLAAWYFNIYFIE